MSTSPQEPADDPDRGSEDQDKATPDEEETAPEYVDDSQLPEDLQPTDDNPLAQNEDEQSS